MKSLSFIVLATVICFSSNSAIAQDSSLVPLMAGKTYYVEYNHTAGVITLISTPGTDGWALVEIQQGFANSDLVSKKEVRLNISLAVLIQERADVPHGPKLNDIIADRDKIAANAIQYRKYPTSMGGGGGSYLGYSMPASLSVGIRIVSVSKEEIVFEKQGVRAFVDLHGKITTK